MWIKHYIYRYVIYSYIIVSSCILTFCSTVVMMRLIGYWLQLGSLKRWIKHLCPRKMYQYAIEFVCCPLDFTCTSLKARERGSHQAVWWFSKTAGDFQPQYPYFPGLWQHFPGWWGPGFSSPWPMWPTPFWESIGHELPTWWCGRRPKKSRRSTVLIQNLGSGMNGSMWMAQFLVICNKFCKRQLCLFEKWRPMLFATLSSKTIIVQCVKVRGSPLFEPRSLFPLKTFPFLMGVSHCKKIHTRVI